MNEILHQYNIIIAAQQEIIALLQGAHTCECKTEQKELPQNERNELLATIDTLRIDNEKIRNENSRLQREAKEAFDQLRTLTNNENAVDTP